MLNCLIIEDHPINWMIMQKQLARLGIHAKICTNGLSALRYCQTHPLPELILLDGYMPKMDGRHFLKALRKLPNGAKPYIVFCSSSLGKKEIYDTLKDGAECHFPKPITGDQIAYAISQAEKRVAALH